MGKWICHINKRRTINIVSLSSAHTRNIFKVTFMLFVKCPLLHQCCSKNNSNINVNSPLKQPSLVLMQVYGCRKYLIVWNQIFRLVPFQQETLCLLFLLVFCFSIFIMDKLASLATAKEQNLVSKYFECVTHEWL